MKQRPLHILKLMQMIELKWKRYLLKFECLYTFFLCSFAYPELALSWQLWSCTHGKTLKTIKDETFRAGQSRTHMQMISWNNVMNYSNIQSDSSVHEYTCIDSIVSQSTVTGRTTTAQLDYMAFTDTIPYSPRIRM